MINTGPAQMQTDDLSLFSDDESVGSIFSSDDEEDVSLASLIPKELESEYKKRDELVKDIEPKYALAMKKIEQAVRNEQMMCRFKHNDISDDSNGTKLNDKTARTSISTHSSSSTTTENQDSAYSHIGWAERVKKWLPLRMTFRLQGLVILLLNCVAYNAGENIIRGMVVLLSGGDVEFENQAGFPACMMFVSFIILCLTGGICDFVNNDTMERVREDMKSRLLHAKWDARIMKWFRRHEALKTTLNVMSFFTFVYSVYAYQEQLMVIPFDIRQELFRGLPSNKLGVITYPAKLLARGLSTDSSIQLLSTNATCVTGVCSLDEFHDLITRQDEAFLASEMSADSYEDLLGNPTAVLVTESVQFWYYLGSAFVAIALLRMMGHKFWSI